MGRTRFLIVLRYVAVFLAGLQVGQGDWWGFAWEAAAVAAATVGPSGTAILPGKSPSQDVPDGTTAS
jgi:hypothetical protein